MLTQTLYCNLSYAHTEESPSLLGLVPNNLTKIPTHVQIVVRFVAVEFSVVIALPKQFGKAERLS